MVDLIYSLVIEATVEPDFFGFFSPELEGFSGIGHSVEDCLYKARWGMKEHVETLSEKKLPIPPSNPDPVVTIRNQRADGVPESSSQAAGNS
jgi:predicted RNase H-like HicB family nuclease